MAQASMLIPPNPQFFDNNGNPLASGTLYFYDPGTSNPKSVYSDSSGAVPIGTQITLDSAGRGKIWLVGYYKVVCKDSLGTTVWTEDNVSSAFSPATSAAVVMNQWSSQALAFTFIGPTQFSVPGDQSTVFLVGSRIKATVTAGTITGAITGVSVGGGPIITTITVQWDLSQALDAGLSAVWTGLLSIPAGAMPLQIPIGAIIDWYKSMVGVPALPYGWVECNGQTLVDPLSPMNGQVIPNMNGDAAGADTFSNSKISVFTRGSTTSGAYVADAIKAHGHGVSALTVNAHTHNLTGGSATAAAANAAHNHTLDVSTYNQAAQAGTGTGVSDLWQKGGSALGETTSISNATPAITLSGKTDVASATGVSGTTDNNGAATETIPKYVTVVKIMRVK